LKVGDFGGEICNSEQDGLGGGTEQAEDVTLKEELAMLPEVEVEMSIGRGKVKEDGLFG